MTDFLDARLRQLEETTPPGLIVHLGAGGAQALPAYQSTGAARILVLEADPEHAASTTRAGQPDQRVEVLNLGVSDHRGPATLQRLNFDQFSGWRAATGLKELFPGLRTTGNVAVELTDVAGLLENFTFPDAAGAVLVLQEHGETGVILDQLIAAEQLTGFSDIILTLPTLALFEGALDGDAIRTRLETQGYRLVTQDISDPDLPQAHYQLDISAQQISLLYAELEQARAKSDAQQETIAALNEDKSRLETRAETLEAELNTLRTQLEQDREDNQAKAEAHRIEQAELLGKVEALNEDKSRLKARAEALEAELNTLHARLEQDQAGSQAKAEAHRTERAELAGKVEALNEDKSRLKARVEALEAELNTLRADFDASKSTETELHEELLRSRGQRELREADLQDLQIQYRQLLESHDEQDSLIAELARDLDQAIAWLEETAPTTQPKSRSTPKAADKKPAAPRKTGAKPTARSKAKSTAKSTRARDAS